MNIPLVDLKTQYQSLKHEIDSAVRGVLENAEFILGRSVAEFEQAFARTHNVAHCVGLSSGTDACHLSLLAPGVGPGDEVIVPVYTFIATAWGATLCGAAPVFVDCGPESFTIDPNAVEAAITSRTKAIVAVHLFGQPADLDALGTIAEKRGLYLVEDAAQAHFAEYKGRKVGGLGRIASFSFYPSKNIGAYGEAGAVTTNDAALAERCRIYRDQGSRQKYYHDSYGHNYRMEGIQGAVLNVKLKYLEDWTNRRRSRAALYNKLLKGAGDLVLPKEMEYARHVYHLYVVQTSHRDALQRFLTQKGIATGLHYPVPLHLQKCFSDLGYTKGDFPVAERLSERCLSLPLYPELTDDQVDYVCESVKQFFD